MPGTVVVAGWVDSGIALARVVAVVATLAGGREQVGSGYLVKGRVVLTAAHCTRDKATDAAPVGLRVIRASDGAAAVVAQVVAAPELDVAVVRLSDAPWEPDLPGTVFARVDRTRSGVLRDCSAIGYPLFQRDPARRARHTAELHGTIYQTDEAETGRLLLREPLLTSLAPGDPGTAAAVEPAGSVWGGLSGALVFHAGRAVGVIVEHHPRQGTAAVQLAAFDSVAQWAETDEAARRVADALELSPVQRLAWAAAEQQHDNAADQGSGGQSVSGSEIGGDNIPVARARRATPSRTIAEFNPLRLGVHRAVHVEDGRPGVGAGPPVLTPYVLRSHDRTLRESLRTGHRNQLVVLVGGSSTGKTRACYEAVGDVLSGWPVVHPATAEELLALLEAGVEPGTVVWLNETQRYLQPPLGQEVADALQRLLERPPVKEGTRRVVVLGSMWLSPYWLGFTRPPQPGEPNELAGVRDLLTTSCLRLDVPDGFQTITDEEYADLLRLAEQDARLRTALVTGGDQRHITQVLAGGPLLLQRYADLEQAHPVAHAVLSVGMDAFRVGFVSPLPRALLKDAVSGYLEPRQRAAAPGWLSDALAVAGQETYGVCALSPVRTDNSVGVADGFVLHDYLAQYAIGPRCRQMIPADLWAAAIIHAPDLDDLLSLEANARCRALKGFELKILRAQADSGISEAADLLGQALAITGDDEALAKLRTRADADGDLSEAAIQLNEVLVQRVKTGDDEALAELRGRADAGDDDAAERLAMVVWSRGVAGDAEALAELRAQADAGDSEPLVHVLCERLRRADKGALAELKSLVDIGNISGISHLSPISHFLVVLADRASEGDEEALAELRHANAGLNVMYCKGWLTSWEDLGDTWREAAPFLKASDMLNVALSESAAKGDDEAMAELRARIYPDDEGILWSIVLAGRAKAGDEGALDELYAQAGTGKHHMAAYFYRDVAVRRAEAGDEEALAALRTWIADESDRDTLRQLHDGLNDVLARQGQAGDERALAELRVRADAHDNDGADYYYFSNAAPRLNDVLAQRAEAGDGEALAELRVRAGGADDDAAKRLTEILAAVGDEHALAELRREVIAGTEHAAAALLDVYARGDPQLRIKLERYGLDVGGFPAEPW